MKPVFFPTPASFRAWLSRHNRQRNELWVGFYKRSSGKPSITWPESVDEALCFGWIDGIRKRLGEESHVIRWHRRPATSALSSSDWQTSGDIGALFETALPLRTYPGHDH